LFVCGIVAALPDYDCDLEDVAEGRLLAALPRSPSTDGTRLKPEELETNLETLIAGLAGAAELYAAPRACYHLMVNRQVRAAAVECLEQIGAWLGSVDHGLDQLGAGWDIQQLERIQQRMVRARDLLWSLTHDRLDAAARAATLARNGISSLNSARAYLAIDTVLDAVDRLEVRGRDSAGIQLWITYPEQDADRVPASLRRRDDAEYRHRAVRFFRGGLSMVYKRASIIGRLGGNVAFLRQEIAADDDLHAVLALPGARAIVVAHTRWASVGRVSEANAHPVDSVVPAVSPAAGTGAGGDASGDADGGGAGGGYATAVLNGDIDNYGQLRERLSLPSDPSGISTDAKLIPVMLTERLAADRAPARALAASVRAFDGSFAIAAQTDEAPDELLLAVKGSGQGLYVGLAPACFLVASEVYGLVSWTDRYLRLDGSYGADGDIGTVITLSGRGAGTLAGLDRLTLAGRPRPVTDADLATAEITTRDVARGDFDHYLEKEIVGAPTSFHKSLRGRVVEDGGRLSVALGEPALPPAIRDRFAAGSIQELVFVGQGTAAVACQGIANLARQLLHPAITVEALPATELSAFGLRPDMSSMCLVAVSQSGSTTDTNRAIDLARARGASVLAIVNRRDSDLAHKADGVLYTSDGRDVEMAVASTKAFYSQAATGALLGLEIARICDRLPGELEDSLLRGLAEVPRQLEELQKLTPTIARVAGITTRYPYWSVLGSGPNQVAAEEIRIKLSELCYKTISTDAVEDKKHVDLSAESMVLICAAGTPPGQVRDLTKEVDIFTAHRNVPVVIVDEGVDVPWRTEWVIRVPAAHPAFAWILSTAVGHLFAYHAARTIDGMADPLREALAALEAAVDAGNVTLPHLGRVCDGLHQFLAEAVNGSVRGVLTSDIALRLTQAALLLHSGAGMMSVLPAAATDPVQFVREQLTRAVDELSRSIDSVKHQAKTVTVGTSRGDADLLDNALTEALVEAGADPTVLPYSTLLAVRGFARVIGDVRGATRYEISGPPTDSLLRVTRKTGAARDLPSRADGGAPLTGSKRLAVQSRTVRLVRGALDGRLVLMIPEQTGARVHAITLMHVVLPDRARADDLIELLDLTGLRLEEIRAAVTERDHAFAPAELGRLPVELVLLGNVDEVAEAIVGLRPEALTPSTGS
jgi:glucosamine--fructose-6-phosphate aminotransferase (isomerizing)